MKSLIYFLIIFISSTLYSQETILSFQNLDIKKNIKNVENYSLSDEKTNNLAIILGQKDKITGYLYNSNFEKIGEAAGISLKKKYSEIIGYSITNESIYTLVYSTDSGKNFEYSTINFETGKIVSNEIDFKLDDEFYLETIHYKNRMIMMSATKNDLLILREFTEDFTFEEMSPFRLDNPNEDHKLLTNQFSFNAFDPFKTTIYGITKIDNNVPNTISHTSNKSKLYQKDDNIYITVEDEKSKRTILKILNLSDLKLITKTLKYPEGKKENFKNFNSFIYGQYFFHIASSRDEMIFQVKSFDNLIIKEFYVAKESTIEFKNSPIFQRGSTYSYGSGKKNLNTTKQFLRKITSSNLGISVYQENNNYQITFGSSEVIFNSGRLSNFQSRGTTFNTPGGSVFVPSYSPTFSSFNSYGRSKDVFTNGLFDNTFNHIEGEVLENNIFDRIKEFQDELKWDTAEDVFIHNGTTYFSYWNTREQTYFLLQF